MNEEVYVNGERVSLPATERRLVDWLRDDLGLTGTKEPCGRGHCGGCSVLLDEAVVPACCVLTSGVAGRRVLTIEGLETLGDPLPAAFVAHGAVQCGFCTPGMIVAARALLCDADPTGPPLDHSTVRRALAGNLCRCTGYGQQVSAILSTAADEGLPVIPHDAEPLLAPPVEPACQEPL
ncbi:(2Fe-2S)-binding protein [Nonomuraea mesophila]|uniref:(2Fe-2S)-binding protein n=1 Tax=Nonomuraea mesophila TaxID=2530382 RepID=A0A4R5FU04_9ACTN|nr:2Fe-2S iron-sulfur cluster-binding protein [Nonomuraea mesophila]TDE57391.1 (2Fe-2S)-binding protein [Nonomuraea mesophila]